LGKMDDGGDPPGPTFIMVGYGGQDP
jgi:hypothetical protein